MWCSPALSIHWPQKETVQPREEETGPLCKGPPCQLFFKWPVGHKTAAIGHLTPLANRRQSGDSSRFRQDCPVSIKIRGRHNQALVLWLRASFRTRRGTRLASRPRQSSARCRSSAPPPRPLWCSRHVAAAGLPKRIAGRLSERMSNRLASSASASMATPVMRPPGFAKLTAIPSATGLLPKNAATIGM